MGVVNFMGSHILSSGLLGVIEGVVRKMCTFDNWNKKKNFKESYCIVDFFFPLFSTCKCN
jgi:hypothetical protein